MDVLKNKNYMQYDYISRYTGVPYYYNSEDQREIFGLSKNMIKNAKTITHKVKPADNLHSLALKYYNNPTYWWVIAYYNDIPDAFISLKDRYESLEIPNISTIKFGDLR